jgi:large subunit ribosomal protein L25
MHAVCPGNWREGLSTIIINLFKMKTLEIKGSLRSGTGKKNSKTIREQELVPCVMYGGEEPVHFQIPFNEFRHLVYTPDVFLITLDIDGKSYSAILQDTQWHAVEEKLLHADFLLVTENKPVKVSLPITITGTAKGIKIGGKLKVNLRLLKVKGMVNDLPDSIQVDVTELGLGQSIKVSSLKPSGYQILNNKSDVVATVTVTRAARAAMSADTKGKK